MIVNSRWRLSATAARPQTASVSQIASPIHMAARKGSTPRQPAVITRATSAAMLGPGEPAATRSAPAKMSSEVMSKAGPQSCGGTSIRAGAAGRQWRLAVFLLLQGLAQAVLELAAVGPGREELSHRLAGRFPVVGLPAVHPAEHAVEGARVDALSQLDQLAQQGAAGIVAVVGHRLRSSRGQAGGADAPQICHLGAFVT